MRIQPLATFDCLYLGNRLQKQLGGFSPAELHLLTYLACLLSIYRERPQADWGYTFAGTELGAPFSMAIETAVQALEQWGYFAAAQDRLLMTNIAEQRLIEYSDHGIYQERIECLRAAGASIVAFSVGTVREALGQETDLRRAKELVGSHALLDEPAVDELYEQFHVLRDALGSGGRDLRVPAVAWLTALFQTGQNEGVKLA